MNSIFEKLSRSIRYHYFGRKNKWTFPPTISHLAGGKMAQGTYESNVSETLTRIVQKGDVFIDIGANVGYFSRMASEVIGADGAVYAIEPDVANYCALSENTAQFSNVTTSHVAISDKTGFTRMNHSTNAACHSLVNTDNYLDGKQFMVCTITLDHLWEHFLKEKKINVLKIDVEGAEIMVLNGMEKILSAEAVENMIIEYCPRILKNAGFNELEYYHKISLFSSIQIMDDIYRSMVKDGKINSLSEFKHISKVLMDEEHAVNINLLCQK